MQFNKHIVPTSEENKPGIQGSKEIQWDILIKYNTVF